MGDIMKESDPMNRSKCKSCAGLWASIDKEIRSFIQPAAATDGSTCPGKSSGCPFIYITDDTDADEHWQQG